MRPIFSYWNVHGLGEPIRLMLNYLKIDYEDKVYHMKPDSENPREEWLAEKFTHGFDFPNLPFYIDGDIKITQSNAILRYLARKHNLAGTNEHELVRIEVSEQEFVDFRMGLGRLVYGDIEKDRPAYLEQLPKTLAQFNAFLGGKYEWFGGSKLTYVDFLAYSALNWHRAMSRECLDSFEHLKAFMDRFESVTKIGDYLNSEKFKSWAIFGVGAKWGGPSRS